MRILGVTGSLNSGKDTVAQVLVDHGFFHMSTSDMLRAEKKQVFGDRPEALLKRNDPFAIQLRAEKGAGVLVELISEQYKKTPVSIILPVLSLAVYALSGRPKRSNSLAVSWCLWMQR